MKVADIVIKNPQPKNPQPPGESLVSSSPLSFLDDKQQVIMRVDGNSLHFPWADKVEVSAVPHKKYDKDEWHIVGHDLVFKISYRRDRPDETARGLGRLPQRQAY